MAVQNVFLAGGGTGGHIYPGLAVAQKIAEKHPDVNIHFFCSNRPIDAQILSKTNFTFTQLPAVGLSVRGILRFIGAFNQSCKIAKETLVPRENALVIGIGGFASAPVCFAAHRLNIPVKLVNVDIVPGKSNKLCKRWANEVFVQFEDTAGYFKNRAIKVTATGCPLRKEFEKAEAKKAKAALGLNESKKILLVTGASSGAQNINEAVCSLLSKLSQFKDNWQIVHLSGKANYDAVKGKYGSADIEHTILDYYDDMADLLAAADLVIGRSGAVSVAEFAASNTPAICIPYPHHRDMHQYLNAEKLVLAEAAIVVDDLPDLDERADWLWQELQTLLKEADVLESMKHNCEKVAIKNAADTIVSSVL